MCLVNGCWQSGKPCASSKTNAPSNWVEHQPVCCTQVGVGYKVNGKTSSSNATTPNQKRSYFLACICICCPAGRCRVQGQRQDAQQLQQPSPVVLPLPNLALLHLLPASALHPSGWCGLQGQRQDAQQQHASKHRGLGSSRGELLPFVMQYVSVCASHEL